MNTLLLAAEAPLVIPGWAWGAFLLFVGDILCFLDGGEGLHTCVYIADDIVLTKNGDSILAPWVLMQVTDVEAIYRRSPETRIQGFRLKR